MASRDTVTFSGAVLPAVIALILAPGTAGAGQGPGQSKWEIEIHAGDGVASNPGGGTATTTPAGAPFTTGAFRPSRAVPTYYFGDGATLLNQINSALFANATITSLDPALGRPLAERKYGRVFGARVARHLAGRFSAEASFDYSLGRLEMTDEARAAIEASRSSFITAWNGLLRTGPFANPVVTSNATFSDDGARQMVATGALNIELATLRGFAPYLTVGAGVTSSSSDAPRVVLAGNYQFSLFGSPFNDRDTVTLAAVEPETLLTGVVGGGFKYAVSARWGLRVDVRDHITRNSLDTIVSAEPSVTIAPGIGTFIPSVTTPSMQFSNTTRERSTLSGTPIANFRTFEGSGMRHSVAISTGVFWRF